MELCNCGSLEITLLCLSVWLGVCLSVCLSTCAMIAVFVQINPFNIIDRICNWYLSICPSSILLELYLSIYLSIHLFICLNKHVSVYPSVGAHWFVCLIVCMSVWNICWLIEITVFKQWNYISRNHPLPAYPFPFKSSIAI